MSDRFSVASEYTDANNNGMRDYLGESFVVELRTGARRSSIRSLEPAGNVLRSFAVATTKQSSKEGKLDLVSEAVSASGPPGEIGHYRVATVNGFGLIEGDVVAAKTQEEARVAKAAGAMVFLMPTLELVEGQRILLDGYFIGGKVAL